MSWTATWEVQHHQAQGERGHGLPPTCGAATGSAEPHWRGGSTSKKVDIIEKRRKKQNLPMFAPAARESPPPGHDWSVDGSEVMLEGGCGLVAARKVYKAPSSDGGRDVFGGFHQPDRDPATLARRIWRVCPIARKRRYLSSTQSARFILRSSSVDHFSVSVAVRELGAGSLSLDFSSLSSPFQLPHSLRIFAELLYSRLPGGAASDGVTPLSQTLRSRLLSGQENVSGNSPESRRPFPDI